MSIEHPAQESASEQVDASGSRNVRGWAMHVKESFRKMNTHELDESISALPEGAIDEVMAEEGVQDALTVALQRMIREGQLGAIKHLQEVMPAAYVEKSMQEERFKKVAITRLHRFIREYSLDELAAFSSVLPDDVAREVFNDEGITNTLTTLVRRLQREKGTFALTALRNALPEHVRTLVV